MGEANRRRAAVRARSYAHDRSTSTGDGVILAPVKGVLTICDALDAAITRFLQERDLLHATKYESDREALLIFNLGIRHVEGVTALARRDLVSLPAAYHLARAAFECCVRAAWLVDDPDQMRREARWLAHLEREISDLLRSSERLEKAGHNVARRRERARTLTEFKNDVGALLESHGVKLLKKVPNFHQMLDSIGGRDLYPLYIEASDYSHGGHGATWLYRRNGIGTHAVIGENIRAEQWIVPLRTCWLALGTPGDIITTRIAQSSSAAWSHDCRTRVDAAFENLAAGLARAARKR
jgi:hypothetical protein